MIPELSSQPTERIALPGTLGVRAGSACPVVHDGQTPGGLAVPHMTFPNLVALLRSTSIPLSEGSFLRVGRTLFRQGRLGEDAVPLRTAGGVPLWPVAIDGRLRLSQFGAYLDGADHGRILTRALGCLPAGGHLEIGGTLTLTTPPALPPDLADITLARGRILLRPAAGQGASDRPPRRRLLRLTGWQRCRLEHLELDPGQGHPQALAFREIAIGLEGCRDIEIADCRFDDCYCGVEGLGRPSRGIRILRCEGQARGSIEALRRQARAGLASSDNTGPGKPEMGGAGAAPLSEAAARGHALRHGGSAMIAGSGVMEEVLVRSCRGGGWNHLVLSGDSRAWWLDDCHLADSGDSAFYLRGSDHRITGCQVARAGKDAIKILDYTSGAAGAGNLISGCQVRGGAGHTRPDGGKAINCETDDSLVEACRIDLTPAPPARLAAAGQIGVYLSGSRTRLCDTEVTGPGPGPKAGRTHAVALRTNKYRATRQIRVANVTARQVTRLWAILGRDTPDGLQDIELRDCWGEDCLSLGQLTALGRGPVSDLRVQGGGVRGARGDAVVLAAAGARVTLEGVSFLALAPGRHCIRLEAPARGSYRACPWDGSGAAFPILAAGTMARPEAGPGAGPLSGRFP